jgi:2-amino-4-hydroxy-6-hydroxymethyldihydropteridine diphosphokinase
VGLGSNLDEPITQVTSALAELSELPHTQLLQASSLYASKAVGPGEQPDYINAVACLSTELDPEPLLDLLQTIEQGHQRQRIERWGPRTLDLDILLFAQQTLNTARLSVPHPYLPERNFVLQPLLEVAPQLTLPDGTSVARLAQHCGTAGLRKLAPQG